MWKLIIFCFTAAFGNLRIC